MSNLLNAYKSVLTVYRKTTAKQKLYIRELGENRTPVNKLRVSTTQAYVKESNQFRHSVSTAPSSESKTTTATTTKIAAFDQPIHHYLHSRPQLSDLQSGQMWVLVGTNVR